MDTKKYVPLHVHTEYSLLDGALRIEDYLAFAKQQGWPAVAITDHGNIFGAIKLAQLAKKAGVKAIIGCEMYLIPDVNSKSIPDEKYFHLTVLVQNRQGYANLCRLFDFAYSKGFYFKPRIDYNILAECSEGLIIGSGCLGSHVSKLLRHDHQDLAEAQITWFKNVFGPERFFLEVAPVDAPPGSCELATKVQLHNDLIFAQAQKFGLKVVAAPDSHYFKAEHRTAHEVMLSIGTKDLLSNPDRFSFGDFKGHLKSTQEMLDAFPNNPEVVYNSYDFAMRCDFEFEFGKLHFPDFKTPTGVTKEEFFACSAKEGLEEIFSKGLVAAEKREQYFSRLQLEIDLISKMGFVGYFLVVSDFISWAKQNDIPVGPGRGSAAGSLVAWALKITNIDPIEYNLLFERFLNPERVSMPDIDIDFCIEGRERVIQYVRDKYGHECVCQIITFGTMMAKGVIKDVARVLGFPFADSNAITELVPDQLKITLKEAIEQEPRLKNLIETNAKAKEMIDICLVLEGLTRHASKHAAGVVISPQPLRDVLPLYIPPKTTELVTQFSMLDLEYLGYLKMDFLGLKNLTVIDRTVKAIKATHDPNFDLDTISRDDEKTFVLLGQGKTCGVFQFEGSGVTEVIQRLKPNKFEDLIAVNALYRPGPLASGMVEDFIEGRHGRKKPNYMFPELEPILQETYGVIVYQEQVMKIASAIAGYSLGGADLLRRAMGKKKAEVMAEQEKVFVTGAIGKGFNGDKSKKLFDLMAFFAGYGFNKSHSAAYALIAYHTAYLKAHYPAEFEAAILSFETSDPDKLREYLNKTRQVGLKVLPPNINTSAIEFVAVSNEAVLFGLQGVKNLGEAVLQEIVKQRAEKPFVDMLDFCKRVSLRVANKRVIESLICSGAMDELSGTRAQKMAELEDIMALAQQEKDRESKGQVDLFAAPQSATSSQDAPAPAYKFKTTAQWSQKEQLEKEKDVIGFYVSEHPLDAYAQLRRWVKAADLSSGLENDKAVTVLGMVTNIKTLLTKKGDRMAFLTLEDCGTEYEVVLFPTVLSKVEDNLIGSNMLLITGQVDGTSTQKVKIKAQDLVPLDQLLAKTDLVQQINLTLPQEFSFSDLTCLTTTNGVQGLNFAINFMENLEKLRAVPAKGFAFSLQDLATLASRGVDIEIQIKQRTFSHRPTNFAARA